MWSSDDLLCGNHLAGLTKMQRGLCGSTMGGNTVEAAAAAEHHVCTESISGAFQTAVSYHGTDM